MEDLPKQYHPDVVEEKWSYFWEKHGIFHADPLSDKPPYCIVLPPPNITGILHMGHALVDSLQDMIIRWKRMCGFEALWVPGTDHAGISTQTVVERYLMATEGKRRSDYSRENFLSRVWKWKEKNEREIIDQLKKLGCSCDWMRHRFTMDKEANFAVRTLFKKLYDDELIYRGDYLVNWDPVTQTALADDEVEYETRESYLWYLRYSLDESEETLVIATTRPETMLGDVAVAVSPEDPRYKKFIGKKLVLPIVGRLIPILADRFVDPEFGTGIVKITPAHDPNDYELGLRHNLKMINILNPDGTLNENGLEFEGLSTIEARYRLIERLKREGRVEKIEPHTHRVGISYRSKAPIEPYLSKQWFIKMSAFKKDLIKAVRSNEVKIIPKNWEQTYFHWIENLRDWCISRQLWWGHRIPIWYSKDDPENILCYAGDGDPPEVKRAPDAWVQDDDVLDTWFSSALWPFSALGWPHQTNELKKFYPNATLITGHDILFFWVARMIMMGKYVMGTPPFPETNLQGLIFGKSYWRRDRDGGVAYVSSEEKKGFDLGKSLPNDVFSKWEKMSKSKGNVIDPIEMINSYGADAIRMALAASATQSMQIDLDRRRFEEFKNFTNKIWNGSRFVLMNISDLSLELFSKDLDLFDALEDQWIFSLLNRVIQEMNHDFKGYHFDRAALKCYHFFWDEFCAYYVEMSKPSLFGKRGDKEVKQKILVIILLISLRLMHPIAPFVTEEIFQLLKSHFAPITQLNCQDPYTQEAIEALSSTACAVSPYPQVIRKEDIRLEIEQKFQLIHEIVRAIRNIRAEIGLPPSKPTDLFVRGSGEALKILEENQGIITSLVPIDTIKNGVIEGFYSSAQIGNLKIAIPLPKEFLEKEKKRLEKEKKKCIEQVASIKKQLDNPQFTRRAPKELVKETKEKLLKLEESLETTKEKIQAISRS